MARTLTFNIFRYNPGEPDVKPRMDEFRLTEIPMMTLFVALNKIREEQDPSLMFDFVCRAAICGSCGMMVNGEPKLACRTLTQDLPEAVTLMPLPVFKMVGDLAVDSGTWFRMMNERIGGWIHTGKMFDPQAEEARMSNEVAIDIYDADRCIECGCCIAGCATANIREDFLGAAGLNRVARFMVDPRDDRTTANFFEVVGTDEGAFGCVGLMACHDNCPQQVPLLDQLAFVRRKLAFAGLGIKR